jgi:hypothetical protein
MARRPRRSQQEWEELGRVAILDLLGDRRVAPWAEIEARIGAGWKEFPPVQPVQLSGARRALRDEGAIEEDRSEQQPPVLTLRLPIREGSKREIERIRGRKRKLYRKYLSWTGDHDLCGKQGERVLLKTLEAAASEGGLWVPPQTVGEIREVQGIAIERGPLDALAYILDLETQPIRVELPMVVEVKNIGRWIYPEATELWELLVKAAQLASAAEVLPVLACMRSAYQTFQMAKDLGFFAAEFRNQIFSPRISESEFDTVVEEFGLQIERSDGPVPSVETFIRRTLRTRPPPTPPFTSDLPWYRQQADRFSAVAPLILAHSVLAEETETGTRRRAFESFRAGVSRVVDWQLVKGW